MIWLREVLVAKGDEHKDPEEMPETKRFQVVELPHGPLVSEILLDKVEDKLTDTFSKRKRSGKDGRIYLLSHVLEFEDGSTYYGGPAKDRQYFYYYCKGKGPNIRCEETEKVVIERIKGYFKGSQLPPPEGGGLRGDLQGQLVDQTANIERSQKTVC